MDRILDDSVKFRSYWRWNWSRGLYSLIKIDNLMEGGTWVKFENVDTAKGKKKVKGNKY